MSSLIGRSPRWLSSLAVAALLGTACVRGSAAEIRPGFQERVFHDGTGDHKYTLFVPADYTPEKKWPVILYLHGSSARGTDARLPLVGGLAPQVRARKETFPFLVVFPQCEDRETRLLDGWLASTADGARALKILDAVEQEFSVDRRREILTGWSMGGVGAWSLAAAAPSRWSALVVVAGCGDPTTAPALKNIPIWAFHGAKDFTVPIDEGQQIIRAAKGAGARAYFTELAGVRHNIAHVVYGDDALYRWMLDPASEPRPESFVRNARRAPNEAEMGHDFVHPFFPAAEIPQSLYVRMDKDAIESLADAIPDLVPPDAISGIGPDVHQKRRAFLTRFDVSLSGINYRGTLERIEVTTHDDGWATIALGLRELTTEIGSTNVKGRMLSAAAGPMEIVVGSNRPVWLTVRLRPYVEARRIKFELGETHFQIPDDNWYVTTPSVEARGFPLVRRRVSKTLASRLVEEIYRRKGEIESQVAQSAPQLVQKLETQLDEALSKTRTLGSWPMPAYQPPFRLWADRLRVNRTGVSLLVGITVGRPALDDDPRPPKRIERPPVSFDDLPNRPGLQFGISGAFLEGFTAVVADAGVASADVLDLHTPELRALADPANMVAAIPDLAQFGDGLQVRARLRAIEPMLFGAAPLAESDNPESDNPESDHPESRNRPADRRPQRAVQLQMPHLQLTVDIRTSPEQKAWRHCAEFDLRLTQRIDLALEQPDFETRVFRLRRPCDADISVTGRFADDYAPADKTLHTERVAALFRDGWRAAERMELLQQMSASDFVVGSARLRVAEVGWLEPFLVRRYLPARTRITNGTQEPFVYTVRGRDTDWGGPYTLEAGSSHDFTAPYSLTVRQKTPAGEEQRTVPMGSHFVFGSRSKTNKPPLAASAQAPNHRD